MKVKSALDCEDKGLPTRFLLTRFPNQKIDTNGHCNSPRRLQALTALAAQPGRGLGRSMVTTKSDVRASELSCGRDHRPQQLLLAWNHKRTIKHNASLSTASVIIPLANVAKKMSTLRSARPHNQRTSQIAKAKMLSNPPTDEEPNKVIRTRELQLALSIDSKGCSAAGVVCD